MNDLIDLYSSAADLDRTESDFNTVLSAIDTLPKAALLQLATAIGFVGGARLSASQLREALRAKIANRRGAAARCMLCG